MKVGLIIYGDLDCRSGGYFYDYKLVEYLRRKGDQVKIFSLPEKDYYAAHLIDSFRVRYWVRVAVADIDILLQDELNHPSLLIGNIWLRTRVNYPIVTIVHHLRSSEPQPVCLNQLYTTIEKYYLNTVDGVICNSKTTLQSLYGLSVFPNAIIAYPGISCPAAVKESEVNASANEVRILFVGNVVPRKNVHRLIKAVYRLKNPSVQLDIAGSITSNRDYVRRIGRLTADLGVEQQVRMRGRVSDSELASAFKACDLVVVPSSYEGLGIVYLEAMSYGKPVIATSKGGATDIIDDEKNGYLIDPGDLDQLTFRLKQLVDDPELRRAMGKRGRKRALNHPVWEESMSRVRRYLLKLVEESR